MTSPTERCACGQPLHYRDQNLRAMVQALIDDLGPEVPVTVGQQTWLVPRHYIALHGLRASELPVLARRFGFHSQ